MISRVMRPHFRAIMIGCAVLLLAASLPTLACAQTPPFILKWGATGSGDGQFLRPRCIAVGPSGEVYVGDLDRAIKIQKFSVNGVFQGKWGTAGSGPGLFADGVWGLAVAPGGNVYALDRGEIEVFGPTGAYLATLSSFGTGPGQLRFPNGIAIGSDGSIYVADTNNWRVQKFSSAGQFVREWGAQGTGDGQFLAPYGIAVGPDGFVYVSDFNASSCRIQKFTSDGVFLAAWGTPGTAGDGVLANPFGLSVDPLNRVFVADTGNDQVQVFTTSGAFVSRWGAEGTADGQFDWPADVAIDGDGFIYVVDAFNNRIQKFGPASTPASSRTWGRVKAQYR